jgi:hypothetical protein
MKIIDIGKCIDNVDPKGMGRIRVSRYNDYTAEIEKAIDYEPWSDRDLFLALPFLPSNINFIPEINQSVKIVTYNTDHETINKEYIAGPFTTMYDYNSQTFSQQVADTTYGNGIKNKPNIRNASGVYINRKSENAFAKEKDFAVYGKFGSDILFTENGLQLRGGKLLSKEAASIVNKTIQLDYPLMAKKSSRIYLKKFPKKMTLNTQTTSQNVADVKDVNYVVEYTVDNLKPTTGNTATIKFFVYKVTNPLGERFKTNFFSEHSDLAVAACKLINDDNSLSTPTYTITGVTSVPDIYMEIRDKIFTLHDKGLESLSPFIDLNSLTNDIHPFFFRPTSEFRKRTYPSSDTGSTYNHNVVLNNINVRRIGPASGLIWSTERARPTTREVVVNKIIPVVDPDSPEQSFGAITADKFFILSTDLENNETDSPVPFIYLNEYEYTQEDYVRRIEPNTFATVRGENLLILLENIIEVIFSHVHNPLMPISGQPDYEQGNKLKELLKTIENDILNKSIRIN